MHKNYPSHVTKEQFENIRSILENNNQLSSALLFNSEIDLNKIKLIQNWKKIIT